MAAVDSVARRIGGAGWSSTYFPVDFFEYLTSAEAVDWVFDQVLLEAVAEASRFALAGVDPRHFLEVVDKFLAGSAPEGGILDFVHAYFAAHEVAERFADLPSAVRALRRMAEG